MKSFFELYNHPIYVVGGAVRNFFLGIPADDIDLASSLTPEQFKKKSAELGYKTFDTGLDHGTIMVRIDGKFYEHTTFRYDVSCDGRNATVSYAKTIEEDLSRRDFTINAIAQLNDEIIDPFGGQNDLKNRFLRTVGKASERFQEDYLRIIRAARFASHYNLILDDSLVQAARELACRILEEVAIERIMQELNKSQSFINKFFTSAKQLGFLSLIFPFVEEVDGNNFQKALGNTQRLEQEEYYMRLFFLVEKNLSVLCNTYRLSNRLKKAVLYAQQYYSFLINDELTSWELFTIYSRSPSLFVFLWSLVDDVYGVAQHLKELLPKVKFAYEKPFIDGNKLIKWGIRPNENFKDYLRLAIVWQMAGDDEPTIITRLLKQIG